MALPCPAALPARVALVCSGHGFGHQARQLALGQARQARGARGQLRRPRSSPSPATASWPRPAWPAPPLCWVPRGAFPEAASLVAAMHARSDQAVGRLAQQVLG